MDVFSLYLTLNCAQFLNEQLFNPSDKRKQTIERVCKDQEDKA